jgi:hypothetical protein
MRLKYGKIKGVLQNVAYIALSDESRIAQVENLE